MGTKGDIKKERKRRATHAFSMIMGDGKKKRDIPSPAESSSDSDEGPPA